MAAIRPIHSFSTHIYLLLTLPFSTDALPYQILSTSSTPSLPRSISLSPRAYALTKRTSDNNVGAAVGPLFGSVVLCFALYFLYQFLRKRKDKKYFLRKEGDPHGRGTPATTSSTTRSGGKIERKRSDKSDSSTSTTSGRSEKSMGKSVGGHGALEIMIKEEEEGLRPLPPVHSERRDSRTSRGSVSSQNTASQPASRETSRDRSSIHTLGGDSIGSVRLSQGPQRTVEVKKPDPVRHKPAGVRGSEYWSKYTSASQLAPE